MEEEKVIDDQNELLSSKDLQTNEQRDNRGLSGFKLFFTMFFIAIVFLIIGIIGTTYYIQGDFVAKPADCFKLNKAKVESDLIIKSILDRNQKKEALKNILIELKGVTNFSSDNIKMEINEFCKQMETLILREDEIVYLDNCKRKIQLIMSTDKKYYEKSNELGNIYYELKEIASKTTKLTQMEIASLCVDIEYIGKREGEKNSLELIKKKMELMIDNDLTKTESYNEIISKFEKEITELRKNCDDSQNTEVLKKELSLLIKSLTEKLDFYKKLKEEHDSKLPEYKKRFDELVKNFNVNEDKLEKRTRYVHKNSPSNPWARTDLYLSISSTEKYLFLFINFQYVTTSDLLFAKYVTLYIDEKKYDVNDFKYSDWQHDNGFGKLWEYASLAITDESKKVFEELANSKEATLRFHGSKYYDDFKVNEKSKIAIKETIELYDLLNELRK